MNKQKEHIFITDPFSELKQEHDTSICLIEEALALGYPVWQTELDQISFSKNQVLIEAFALSKNSANKLIQEDLNQRKTFKFDCNVSKQKKEIIVWMRKDPPVDQSYIQVCQLLRLIKEEAFVVNNPEALLFFDEKLAALGFPDLIPETLVTSKFEELKSFLEEQQKIVLKPIGGKAGEGILVLEAPDKNLRSIFEIVSKENQSSKIIAQEYLPEISQGDKRIFLLDGKPLGALLRIPQKDDHRANMAAGGSVQAAQISEKELEICARLEPNLKKHGLYIVGLDLIGEKVTEINITSPTCLREISDFDRKNYAKIIINWSDKHSDLT